MATQVAHAPTRRIRAIFARFWPDTRPFRGRMVLSLGLASASPALSTASIWLFKVLVDDVLTPHDYRLFLPVAGAYLALTAGEGLVNFADQYLTTWIGEKFVLNLRVRVFEHLQRLSPGYFETSPLGDLLARLTGDVSAIESLALTSVNVALTYSFQILFYTLAMGLLNWQLTLAAFVAAPGFLLLARTFSRRLKDASRERRRRAGSIGAVAEEALGNISLVQAYGQQAAETRRFQDENLGSFRAQMRATRLEALYTPVSTLLETIGVLLVIGLAVWEIADGHITLGGLLVFVTYLTQLYGPVSGFGSLWNGLFSAAAGAERIIEILDTEPTVREAEEPVGLARARGSLRLHRVTFTYPGASEPVLRGLDQYLAPGTRTAVVGASGAGKTTLTKLLLRFYDPDEGSVSLDGIDLRDLAMADLRRNVTVVLQETLVFDGTVEDNLRYGRPEADREEIEAAARAADAHDFITALPDGYRTRIGQRGRLLSGGQRQRLAIARAMLRDSPVLILDEPTTGLDAEATQRVMQPLRRLMQGRTTLVISHNLLTVTDVDRILFLEGGRLTAAGTHAELLAGHPGYARLYQLHHPVAPRPAPERVWLPAGDSRPRPARPLLRPVRTPGPVPVPGSAGGAGGPGRVAPARMAPQGAGGPPRQDGRPGTSGPARPVPGAAAGVPSMIGPGGAAARSGRNGSAVTGAGPLADGRARDAPPIPPVDPAGPAGGNRNAPDARAAPGTRTPRDRARDQRRWPAEVGIPTSPFGTWVARTVPVRAWGHQHASRDASAEPRLRGA